MDILNEIISLLKRNFPERIQMFSNRGISHDEKLTIYQKRWSYCRLVSLL
jgi:hypothetical protein